MESLNASTLARPVRRLRLRHSLALFVPALIFGYLVANQAVTQSERSALAVRYNAPLVDAASALQKEQNDLKTQLAELRTKLDEIQKAGATQSGLAGDISRQIETLQARSGLSAVTGEGVIVTLDDAHTAANAKEIEKSICHNTDITDIVNTGWRAGAEAIAVNGERMVGTSSVYCVGSTIMVNGTLMSPPFRIAMIGRQSQLMAVFGDPRELADIKSRSQLNGLIFNVSRQRDIAVPAYTGSLGARYAVPR
jgi:uncharacterized protein YlxW (UPF0749 family)